MRRIVLDTNCLLMSIPKISPFRPLWDGFLSGNLTLCVSNEIIEEYLEIISQKTTVRIANNIVSTILNRNNVEMFSPTYRFQMIKSDPDDNKFVDCAIVAGAICIVSNDSHFKELANIPFPKVNVFRIEEYLHLFMKNEGLV